MTMLKLIVTGNMLFTLKLFSWKMYNLASASSSIKACFLFTRKTLQTLLYETMGKRKCVLTLFLT